jgi:hypothetical protein
VIDQWQWRAASPGNKYCIRPFIGADVQDYTVAKIGSAAGFKYEAWHAVRPPQYLGLHPTPEAAKQACASHAISKSE